ncbi:MAG TPA: hypothetical protein VMN76_06725 [Acidobacteriota bacterium]|nr:hypothetical protein [Acidobacteriota bacterium]
MKKVLWQACLVLIASAPLTAQATTGEEPVSVAYFYTVKWGFQDEFLDLFRRNHYPVLKAQQETGRLLDVQTYTPRFHGDGRSDWTFLVILTFRSWQAMAENSEEQEIIERLYPDHEKFRSEEQRRFELLLAHWDVPLRKAAME